MRGNVWSDFSELLKKKERKLLVTNLLKQKEEITKFVELYEKCLGIRITLTRRMSKYMSLAAGLDRKLLHTLELISRIGLNTKFHKKQTSKAIDMLQRLNRLMNDFERKLESSFSSFKGKYEITEKYLAICDILLEMLQIENVPWKSVREQVDCIPNVDICCGLGLPQGYHLCEVDVNNNVDASTICLDSVNGVLEQYWKGDIAVIESQLDDYKVHYTFICSLYSIKDDWEEGVTGTDVFSLNADWKMTQHIVIFLVNLTPVEFAITSKKGV